MVNFGNDAVSKQADDAPRNVRAGCPRGCLAVSRPVSRAFDPADGPWRVVECAGCGLYYTDPRPPRDDWARYYPDDYGPYHASAKKPRLGKRISRAVEGFLASHATSGWSRALARLYLDVVVPPVAGEGRLLDIGCGSGEYLARMRNAGWDVLGLEPSHSAAERAEERFRVPVICDTFPSRRLAPRTFDLVSAHQVLEHLENPRDALVAMRDLLDADGRVLLTVPNAASWSARYFGPAWLSWDLPRHLTHFTARSLAEMADLAGLEPIVLRTLPQGGWIRESAACAKWNGWPASRRWFLSRPLSGAAARFSTWTNQGDNLLLIACRKGDR